MKPWQSPTLCLDSFLLCPSICLVRTHTLDTLCQSLSTAFLSRKTKMLIDGWFSHKAETCSCISCTRGRYTSAGKRTVAVAPSSLSAVDSHFLDSLHLLTRFCSLAALVRTGSILSHEICRSTKLRTWINGTRLNEESDSECCSVITEPIDSCSS